RNGAVTLDTNNAALCAIGCPAITLSPSTLPNGSMGVAYSQTLSATGGTAPYSFTVVAGALPPGLTLTPSGLLAGAPSTSGSFSFTVKATDANGCVGSQTYVIVINATQCPTIFVTPATLPAANVGVAYSQMLIASGGTAPYTFIVVSGTLPPGLMMSAAGMLTGTPTSTGNFVFTVRATDSAGCVAFHTYSFSSVSATLPVPSLSQWGLLILSLLMVSAVGSRQRRGE
ncbi:MAG: IPTL-CTERM sorting domain-containing protein, partial [Dokdonella sp.]